MADKEITLPDPGKLLVSSSPHLHDGDSVRRIMLLVVLALLPACLAGVWFFGVHALRVLVVCVVSCVVFEALVGRLVGRPNAWKDGSALVTGLLLGMILSAATPWWVCVIGAFLAIVIAKQLYGGLGFNPFNPALVARIGLIIGFPKILTTWVPTRFMAAANSGFIDDASREALAANGPVTFVNSVVDGVTCATPLGEVTMAELGEASAATVALVADPANLWNYAIGNVGGCIGETSAIALLAGGVFLLAMRVINWRIPVAFIGTTAVFAAIVHACAGGGVIPGAAFQILTGGLLLGAFFMATDMVTTPITAAGQLIFGAGCGILTCVIRFWGAYPEGVMFSIILMNACTPLIERFTRKKPFGHQN